MPNTYNKETRAAWKALSSNERVTLTKKLWVKGSPYSHFSHLPAKTIAALNKFYSKGN